MLVLATVWTLWIGLVAPANQTPPSSPPANPLVALGVPADGVKISQSSAQLRLPVSLYASAAGTVNVAIPALVGPESSVAAVTFTLNHKPVQTLDVRENDRVTLVLAAELPLAGIYTTTIHITAAGRAPLAIPVQITRTHAAATIAFKDVVSTAGTVCWLSTDVSVRFGVHETAGVGVRLLPPQLGGLARLLPDAKLVDVGGAVKSVVAIDGATSAETQLGAGQTITLGPGAFQQFKIVVSGLRPGVYNATLHAPSANAPMQDQPVTLLVRAHWWQALLAIAAGIWASKKLRDYYTRGRAALVNERSEVALRAAVADLRGRRPLDDEASAVLTAIQNQGLIAAGKLKLDSAYDPTPVFAKVGKRLMLFERWMAARTLVAALRPARLAAPFQQTLRNALRVLELDDEAEAAIEAARKNVEQIPAAVRAALSTEIDNVLKVLDAELKRQEQRKNTPSMIAGLEEVRRRYDAAVQAKQRDDLPEAIALADAARAAYVPVLAAEFKASLTNEAPLGVDPAVWNDIRTAVSSMLATAVTASDPARALEQYRAAHQRYLEAVLAGAGTDLDTQRTVLAASQTIQEPVKKEIKQALDEIEQRIADARTRIAAGELDAASDQYRALAEDLVSTGQRVFGPGRLSAADGTTTGPAMVPGALPAGVAGTTTAVHEIPDFVVGRPEAEAITRRLKRADRIATWAIAFIAVLLGLKVWAANPAWGDFEDFLTAVIWGLGLHQFAFAGMHGLIEKFSK